jgi:hypothetical protein
VIGIAKKISQKRRIFFKSIFSYEVKKNLILFILIYSTMSKYELVKNWAPMTILGPQINGESAAA